VLIALAVLGLVSALVMMPVDRTPLPSSAHPSPSYELAVTAYDSMRAIEAPLVTGDGASLIYVHGHRTPRALVLVHGITNSPRQFRELAEEFHARGYNVIVPRLPLHGLRGGDVDALRALTADKLRDYGDAAANVADGLGDTVLVMGLSTGGLVAAWMAHHRPDVARVVVIAPAIKLARLPAMLATPAMNLADRIPNVTIRQRPDTTRPHAYFGVSTRALAETFRFAATIVAEAQAGRPLVSDLTLVTNGNDRTVDEQAALALGESWAQHGSVSVVRYRFDPLEALPHDVIDVSQRCGAPRLVYPVLIALMEKQEPPPATRERGPCRAGGPAAGP
jgi:alpha-beta hydrolase superfamily lysophospholipase